MNNKFSLYLIADHASCTHMALEEVVARAVQGGVTAVQLRAKELVPSDFLDLGRRVQAILQPHTIPFIINDHVEIALALDADGVHLGQSDMSCVEARRLLGPNKLIGLTVENKAQALAANAHDLDYIGVGPVFPTQTKQDAPSPLGLEGLSDICQISRHPVCAIGGINVENAAQVRDTGAVGIAVASAICQNPDPARISRCLTPKASQVSDTRVCAGVRHHRLLTIAGSDSGGGAGIQADLKTFSALGCYGMSAITALTAQNTCEVVDICPIDPGFVRTQIRAVVEDIGVDAIKIGMLHNSAVIQAIAEELQLLQGVPIVLDPVMIATSQDILLESSAIVTLRRILFPLAMVLTPNVHEAEFLLDAAIQNKTDMEEAARKLCGEGAQAVMVKGGHLESQASSDCLYIQENDSVHWFDTPRIATQNTHGTGCTLSSAIAAYLGKGYSILDAVAHAKAYMTGAIQAGSAYTIGYGHGPVHHFYQQWV